MALIKCPECGKENVSDTATQCPECGFDIKTYVREKKLEEARMKENKIFKQNKQQKVQELEYEKNIKIKDIENLRILEKPENPKFIKSLFCPDNNRFPWFFLTLIFIIFLFPTCFIGSPFIVLELLLIFVALPFSLLMAKEDYKEQKALYQYNFKVWQEQQDWDAYKEKQKQKIIEEYDEYAKNLVLYGERNGSVENHTRKKFIPKCPTCGSTKITKISTMNRTFSVFTAGLASSKIGKQFQCNNCGYKW